MEMIDQTDHCLTQRC